MKAFDREKEMLMCVADIIKIQGKVLAYCGVAILIMRSLSL